MLLPGKGHDRHNHPESEEVLYVLAGEGEQMLDDGGENTFPIKAGDTIYVPTAMFHSTVNTGWQPLRLLALYNPGGAEKALRDLPDFREGDGPGLVARRLSREPDERPVLLIGTLDTKGDEYAFLRDRLRDAGRGRAAGRRRHAGGAADRGRTSRARRWRRAPAPTSERWPRPATAAPP